MINPSSLQCSIGERHPKTAALMARINGDLLKPDQAWFALHSTVTQNAGVVPDDPKHLAFLRQNLLHLADAVASKRNVQGEGGVVEIRDLSRQMPWCLDALNNDRIRQNGRLRRQ